MGKAGNKDAVLECSLCYSLLDIEENEIAGEEAIARIDTESLFILPEFGEALFFKLRDIEDIYAHDYKITLLTVYGEKLILSKLGYRYEDFHREFIRLRNELILKDLLVYESIKEKNLKAQYLYVNCKNEEHSGKCEVRIYETSLTIIPQSGNIMRFPLSFISEVKEDNYKLIVTNEDEERLILSHMGPQFNVLKKILSQVMNEMNIRTQEILKELVPEVNSSILRRVSRLMKDGRAVSMDDLNSVSPHLWTQLENKLEAAGIKEEYEFLKRKSIQNKISIGIKRSLMGDKTGDYVWFLIPIFSEDTKQPGNAIAIEASSNGGSGKATYFFKIMNREKYKELTNFERLLEEVEKTIKIINRCLIAINFRREPIYLTPEQPGYEKYKFSVKLVPELQLLRSLFIGRVFHYSFEQWSGDVENLLSFNINTLDENDKWKK